MSQPRAASASASTPSPGAGGGDQATQYLTFLLGEEVFALDIRSVREIIQVCPMTPVPLMPSFVRGVINLRGAVVPVIDLQARFGRTPAVIGKKTCIVIYDCSTATERIDLGLLVDAVSEVLDIPVDAIEPPPNFGTSVRRDFIQGMGKLGERFAIILEPSRAFDVDDIAALCSTQPAASH
jgi:purine-binding chemotaxis protein CheW